MSANKHTPGPWKYTTSPEGWSYTIHIHQAPDATPTQGWSDVGYIIQTCRGEDQAIQEANARLIAAAPELLAALERIGNFTLSQFMGPHDMALECVNVARESVASVQGYGKPEKSAKTEVPAIVFFPAGSLGEEIEEEGRPA